MVAAEADVSPHSLQVGDLGERQSCSNAHGKCNFKTIAMHGGDIVLSGLGPARNPSLSVDMTVFGTNSYTWHYSMKNCSPTGMTSSPLAQYRQQKML